MNVDESLSHELKLMLVKAKEDLHLASKIIGGGPHRVASSRAYYAAFYAIEAALLSRNLARSTHGGVMSAFNLHFVKTGISPSHFGALISDLFRYRNIADYEFKAVIGIDDARKNLKAGEEIVGAIAAYLVREGFIDPTDFGE